MKASNQLPVYRTLPDIMKREQTRAARSALDVWSLASCKSRAIAWPSHNFRTCRVQQEHPALKAHGCNAFCSKVISKPTLLKNF